MCRRLHDGYLHLPELKLLQISNSGAFVDLLSVFFDAGSAACGAGNGQSVTTDPKRDDPICVICDLNRQSYA